MILTLCLLLMLTLSLLIKYKILQFYLIIQYVPLPSIKIYQFGRYNLFFSFIIIFIINIY